ncbi:NERD domain-containing protein [Thalassobacillus sp. C254]|uniref:NERD domain-containing protein n=1 Tax=Thalassobacillus sp. C254 TaxID=1225341 RepID=UPI0006D25BB9|nr:NERD domain-containing protein [Thalassobacillus sp. C254]
MAHLIKLDDYISRYQLDLQRYPSQFTRLKKERWELLKGSWIQVNTTRLESKKEDVYDDWFEDVNKGFVAKTFEKVKKLRKPAKEDGAGEDSSFSYLKGKTKEDIREIFYYELFQSQLKWASSSLLEESRVHPRYRYDYRLRDFLRDFPDNYFFMYYPVFVVKGAPVEMEIIILSPTEVWCLSVLEGKDHSVFEASSDRFWNEYIDKERKKRLSPLLSLNRMSAIIKAVMKEEGFFMPVRQGVLAPSSMIDNKIVGTKVEMIDKRTYPEWLTKMKRHPSPVKGLQLKTAAALLKHTHTVACERESTEDKENPDDHLSFSEGYGNNK